MANEVVTLYQGDSSDVFQVSLTDENGAAITDLTDYTGHFSVAASLSDDTPPISKAMTKTAGVFRSSITPTESTDLDPGEYIAVVEISNLGDGFRKEVHIPVVINQQGYEA